MRLPRCASPWIRAGIEIERHRLVGGSQLGVAGGDELAIGLGEGFAGGLQPPQNTRHRVEQRQVEGRGVGQVVKTAQHHGEVGKSRLLARLDDEVPPRNDPPIDHAELINLVGKPDGGEPCRSEPAGHVDLATRDVGGDERCGRRADHERADRQRSRRGEAIRRRHSRSAGRRMPLSGSLGSTLR